MLTARRKVGLLPPPARGPDRQFALIETPQLQTLALNFGAWWFSDKLALRMSGAREVSPAEAPELHGMVEHLSMLARLPKPRVYIIDNPQPNAFATGRNPQHAAVAATTGLMRHLSREEIAGVMAHELAHVKNRDTLTMTITATLAGAISMLGNFAFFMGGNRDNNNPLGIIGVLVAIIVAPLAAMIVQMAISRTREYAADRRGAEICGQPLWLASALSKIARTAQTVHNPDAERNPATAHLFIINPLSGERMDNLFSTHPNTGNRIAALERIEQEFRDGGGGGGAPRSAAPERAQPQRPAAPEASGSSSGPSPGPWGERQAEPPAPQRPQQDDPRPNPWGRNPTGPRNTGPRSGGR